MNKNRPTVLGRKYPDCRRQVFQGEVFSSTYCDEANAIFYMKLCPGSNDGYVVVYFADTNSGIYDFVTGVFSTVEALQEHVKGNCKIGRMWLYAHELWETELERLAA